MFGLKIFVQVQTFMRIPPVLPCNFCHPGWTWTEAMSAAVLSTRLWFFTAFFNLNDCFFKILFECFFISCIL